jgi:hypothetical protein
MRKIITSVMLACVFLAGCVTLSSLKTYSSDRYSFKYPTGYTVTSNSEPVLLLTVEKAPNNRLEIFQMKDYGDRPWGFEETATQEEIDGYIPKEQLTVGADNKKYDVWLYYGEKDAQAKADLKAIFESILVK